MDIYHNLQQYRRIASAVSHGVVVMLKKGSNNGYKIDLFRFITLLNANYKILVKVLVRVSILCTTS